MNSTSPPNSPLDPAAFFEPLADPAFVEKVRRIVEADVAPGAHAIDRDDRYPIEAVHALAREGLTALTLPQELDGLGGTLADALALFEEVGRGSGAVATSLVTIFQAATTVQLFGRESARRELLPRFRQGLVASFALTETSHGSDLRNLDTKAIRQGSEWILNGEKAFVTSGSKADLFVMLAESERGVSAFAVNRETPGLNCHIGQRSATFGLRNGPHVDVHLQGARLAEDRLLGEEGRGVRAVATVLDRSRILAAGISLGLARAAFEAGLAYARERVAFSKHVIDFQGIQWRFADLLARLRAARLLADAAARACDRGQDVARVGAEAKLVASELATETALFGIQVCGAHGCREDNPFGRILRDAKSYEIAGGSSEVLRNTIAKAFGTEDVARAARP